MTVKYSRAAQAALVLAGSTLLPLAAAQAAPLPRPAAFAMCGVCHKTAAGEKSIVGPNLWGVGGRKAGAADYNYSPAMKASGKVWNKATLTAYITDPKGYIPGNKMAYAGQKDPKQAAAVVDYLLSLK